MNLRDHDKPCKHTDATNEYRYPDGAVIDVHTQLWTCDHEDCPGGAVVIPDLEAAVAYHNTMRDSLTDSEDNRNHAENVVRYALGLPLGEVTGQIEDYHEAFIAAADAALGIGESS